VAAGGATLSGGAVVHGHVALRTEMLVRFDPSRGFFSEAAQPSGRILCGSSFIGETRASPIALCSMELCFQRLSVASIQ